MRFELSIVLIGRRRMGGCWYRITRCYRFRDVADLWIWWLVFFPSAIRRQEGPKPRAGFVLEWTTGDETPPTRTPMRNIGTPLTQGFAGFPWVWACRVLLWLEECQKECHLRTARKRSWPAARRPPQALAPRGRTQINSCLSSWWRNTFMSTGEIGLPWGIPTSRQA